MVCPNFAKRMRQKRLISTGLISVVLMLNVMACTAANNPENTHAAIPTSAPTRSQTSVTPSATPSPTTISTPLLSATAILTSTPTSEPLILTTVTRLEWTEMQGRINALAWSPDGSILAVASDRGIWLYEPDNTARPAKSLGAQMAVTQMAFAPDGHSLAAVSDDDVVSLWDIRTGEIEVVARGTVIRFTPEGKLAVARHNENGLEVFEDVLSSDERVLLAAQNEPVMFNSDASMLALRTPSGGMEVQLIDVETNDILVSERGINGYSIAFSPEGHQFAYGLPLPNAPQGHHWNNYEATVMLIESTNGNTISSLRGGGQSWIHGLTYSSNGELLAVDYTPAYVGSQDIFIWNINSRSIIAILPQSREDEPLLTTPLAFSPDGTALAKATRDELQLWSIELPQSARLKPSR